MLGRPLPGIPLYCSDRIYGWRGSQLADIYEKPCSPKGFPLRVMPALRLCLNSWKRKQGKPYYFTIVSIQKEILVGLARQTKLQMSTLSLDTPQMVTLSELTIGWSHLTLFSPEQQMGPLLFWPCWPKKVVCSNTWWFKAEFLFRLTFLGWLFSAAYSLPKRRQLVNSLWK